MARSRHRLVQRQGGRYARIRDDLDAAGFDDPDTKYLVYYDGAVDPGSPVRGQADIGILEGGPHAHSLVYLNGACGSGLGTGGIATVIAVHELMRGLNALPFPTSTPGPPNVCPGDAGHPCDDPNDVLDRLVLDSGRDDSHGHPGSWCNVRSSVFSAHLDSPDQTSPTAPDALTATSRYGIVLLSWTPSVDDAGVVFYRVYRDGELIGKTGGRSFQDDETVRHRTHASAVRAANPVGLLSSRPGIRFTVDLGIVDAEGRLVEDTVPPGPVLFLRARHTRTGIVLSRGATPDGAGVRLYRVMRNGSLYAFVSERGITVDARRMRGRWTIRAIDLGDNVRPPRRLRMG